MVVPIVTKKNWHTVGGVDNIYCLVAQSGLMLMLVIVGTLLVWKLLNDSVFFNGEDLIAGWNPRLLTFIIDFDF